MIVVSTYAMIPLAILLIVSLKIRNVGLQSAAETATAGLVTLIPEGLVLLMSVTFAVAAVRLAKRDTLIQQMSATESLASVDTICVDKTGTLTEGELRLTGGRVRRRRRPGGRRRGRWGASRRAPATATRPWRRSPSATPATPGQVAAEVPFSSEWKWSGSRWRQRGRRRDLRARRARHPRRGGRAGAAAGAGGEARARRPRRGGASSPSAQPASRCPTDAAAEPGAAAARRSP